MKPSIYYSILYIAITASAYSATIYSGADLGSVTSATLSDYQGSPLNHSAARFTLSSSTSEIHAVSFYGSYYGGGADPGVTTDVFDIVFFTNGINGPGSVLGTAQTSLVAEREATGVSGPLGSMIYHYELNLSTAVALSSGDYWIAISRNNPTAPVGTGSSWSWSSDQTEAPAFLSQSGNQFAFSGTDNANPAFTLENAPFSVPEPGSLMLGAIAAVTAIARRRR